MALESANNIADLDVAQPDGGSYVDSLADHIMMMKSVLKRIFPGVGKDGFVKPITATEDQINLLTGMDTRTTIATHLSNIFKVLNDLINWNTSLEERVRRSNDRAYPIGSIYMNAWDLRSPSEILGIGTWAEFSAGRCLVGRHNTTPWSYYLGQIGGGVTSLLPAHVHGANVTVYEGGEHEHGNDSACDTAGSAQSGNSGLVGKKSSRNTKPGGKHSHGASASIDAAGIPPEQYLYGNMPPYVTINIWLRVA